MSILRNVQKTNVSVLMKLYKHNENEGGNEK